MIEISRLGKLLFPLLPPHWTERVAWTVSMLSSVGVP
jgi:hypothetical protein